MSHFDVFNGDADGICALQQLRLQRPCDAVPVTGVKRDIALLRRVPARAGDSVTVLDVSLARNRDALQDLLSLGVAVEYFDHHFAGEIPAHPMLAAHIDPDPAVCTSVLVDRHLQGRHRAWAVTGAFGDNLPRTAATLARSMALGPRECEALRALGEAINYNAYGECEEDLQVAPARLAALVRPYEDPLAFAADSPVAHALVAGKEQDLAVALAVRPVHVLAGASVYLLPDAAWARRVHGAFANALSQREPVRAPREAPQGADALCLAFPTGGGRAGSAGIDALPAARVDDFLRALAGAWPG